MLNPDSIKITGGAKSLAGSDREFVPDQILKSTRLHQTQRVILMAHSDCGAYGGREAFRGDCRKELRRLISDLERARGFVQREISLLQADTHFADFEGVWDPEFEPAAKLART